MPVHLISCTGLRPIGSYGFSWHEQAEVMGWPVLCSVLTLAHHPALQCCEVSGAFWPVGPPLSLHRATMGPWSVLYSPAALRAGGTSPTQLPLRLAPRPGMNQCRGRCHSRTVSKGERGGRALWIGLCWQYQSLSLVSLLCSPWTLLRCCRALW